MHNVDLAIVGGGPAGLAAAVMAYELGIRNIVIIERDIQLGGILQQCIHDGFGLHKFGKQLSGCSYAQKYMDWVEEYGIKVICDTMVIDISHNKVIIAVSNKEGIVEIKAKSIILAMGCRERTRNQVKILGSRPSGVMTAGTVQRYINIEGWKPGTRAVILGSGDIGLIMARRMTLEHIDVEGVYEVMPNLGGLRRNKIQCLDDYNIPLHLATTVTTVHGDKKIIGVTVAKVGSNHQPIKGTERYIPCDLLVLSVGLIPENELSKKARVEMSPFTNSPIVDTRMMTSILGVFVAGNVGAVFDLVDYVSQTGETAAQNAYQYLQQSEFSSQESTEITFGKDVSFVFPQKFCYDSTQELAHVYLRVKKTMRRNVVTVSRDKNAVYSKFFVFATPPEMIALHIPMKDLQEGKEIYIDIEEIPS